MKSYFLMLFSLIMISSCTYTLESDLYSTVDCNITTATFAADVLPIIQKNCLGCHNADANFGNVTMQDYDTTKKYVTNGGFVGSIKHQSGFSPMPKGGSKLSACDIEKVEKWIALGALNN